MRYFFSILLVASLFCGCRTTSPQTRRASYDQSAQALLNQAWDADAITKAQSAGILVKARVVVARDGGVLSAVIIQPSGNLEVDQAVQKVLDTVKNVGPFPADVTDKRKTFIISFSAKPKI